MPTSTLPTVRDTSMVDWWWLEEGEDRVRATDGDRENARPGTGGSTIADEDTNTPTSKDSADRLEHFRVVSKLGLGKEEGLSKTEQTNEQNDRRRSLMHDLMFAQSASYARQIGTSRAILTG